MTLSNSTYYSGTPLARAWNTSTSVTTTAKNQATSTKTPTASPRSATDTTVATNSAVSVSNTPNYGTIHDQKVGVKLLGGLETISSLNDPTFGGLTFESLNKAYSILVGINSTANLSDEQKGVLNSATDAWLEQNPSDAIKLKDPKQASTIARKVADIFKTQILSNYTAATTATMRESTVLGRVALLGSKEFQRFFDKKLTTEQLAQESEKIGTPIKPIIASGQNPTANLSFVQR